MIEKTRRFLRQQRLWLEFQEARREGLLRALNRRRWQRKILKTPPIYTATHGPTEVRVLTWRRDWINVLWALKSFYHFAEVDYPLYIHDGGLAPGQADLLLRHFPNAHIDHGDGVSEELQRRGHDRSLAYRAKNPSMRKVFDFFLSSKAEYQVSIDSDIVFFSRPELLIVPPGGVAKNRYNRDIAEWYSLTPDELQDAFGIKPPARINSGLALIRTSSVDFDAINLWLEHPKLFEDAWVTEQTIHALFSTVHGVELLPQSYEVADAPSELTGKVCKHYPGFFRYALYSEGMAHLVRTGFLNALRVNGSKQQPVLREQHQPL